MLAGMAPNRWLRLEVFHETDSGFHEENKRSLHYGPNVVTKLSLEVPAGRLRIDPSCSPGLLRIISVAIVDAETRAALVFYNGRDCREIELAGTCFAVDYDDQGLLLYAYDNDPILMLPYLRYPGRRLRLEITLVGYSPVAALTQKR